MFELYADVKNLIRIMAIDGEEEEFIRIWNECCSKRANFDEYIYVMDEFNELMQGKTPLEIVNEVKDMNFDVNDTYYFYERGCYLRSFSGDDFVTFLDSTVVADYVNRTKDDLGNAKIRELIEKGE